jgi:hypothetical protein
VATGKKSSSKLHLFKTYICSLVLQEKLVKLTTLLVEHEIAHNIDLKELSSGLEGNAISITSCASEWTASSLLHAEPRGFPSPQTLSPISEYIISIILTYSKTLYEMPSVNSFSDCSSVGANKQHTNFDQIHLPVTSVKQTGFHTVYNKIFA